MPQAFIAYSYYEYLPDIVLLTLEKGLELCKNRLENCEMPLEEKFRYIEMLILLSVDFSKLVRWIDTEEDFDQSFYEVLQSKIETVFNSIDSSSLERALGVRPFIELVSQIKSLVSIDWEETARNEGFPFYDGQVFLKPNELSMFDTMFFTIHEVDESFVNKIFSIN